MPSHRLFMFLGLLLGCTAVWAEATRVSGCEVRLGQVEEHYESFGRLVSSHSPTLSSEVDGRLVEVLVDAGDQVATGAVLARIDPRELQLGRDGAAAEVQRIQATLKNEERRVRRYQDLKKKDYLAETQLEDSQAQIAILRAQLQAAEANLASADEKLERSVLRAPHAGVIQQRLVAEGDFVTRGKALFVLIDNQHLRAELPLPETLAHRLAPGQSVVVSSPLVPGLEVAASVGHTLPQVGSGNRAVTLVVALENPGPLKAGATAIGRITLAAREGVLLVPSVAVVRRPTGETLYRVRDGKAEAVGVTLGARNGDLQELQGPLAAGDRVVCDGAGLLTDGAPVELKE